MNFASFAIRLAAAPTLALVGLAVCLASWAYGQQPSSPAFEVTSPLLLEAARSAPGVHAASAEVRRASALSFRADAAYIPQAELSATFSVTPAMRGNPFAGYSDWSDWGPFFNGRINFGIPLTAFGQLHALRALGDAGVAIAGAQRTIVVAAAEMKALRLYFRWVAAYSTKAALDQAEPIFARVAEYLAEQEESFDPAFDPTDMMKLRVRQGDLRVRRIENNRALAVLDAEVRAWLRLPADTPLKPPMPPGHAELALAKMDSPEEYLRLGAVLRPEVHLAKAALDAADANVMWRSTEFLPALGIVGQFNIRRAPHADIQRGVYNADPFNALGGGAALGMRWGLDLGERLAELDIARSRRAAALALYDSWLIKLRADVAEVHSEAAKQVERVRALAEAAHAARFWFRRVDSILTSSVPAASGAPFDFDGWYRAFVAQLDTEIRLVGAWGDYRASIAALHHAAGLHPVTMSAARPAAD